MPDHHFEARPVSRAQLEELGWRFRCLVGGEADRWLPVDRIVEHTLPRLFGEGFSFEVLDYSEMGGRHGFAQVGKKRLVLREDVYVGMVEGRGRDRMTAIHEVAHMILHPDQSLSRRMENSRPPPYRCPEWQAKCLAGMIMMPARMVKELSSVALVASEFGVSPDAAAYRVKQLGYGGLMAA